MIRLETKKVEVTQRVTQNETRICNMCGKNEQRIIVDGDIHHDDDDIHEISLGGGYGNWVIGDMNSVTFHLCQGCLCDIFESMKIPVVIDTGVRHLSWEEWKETW